MYTIICCCYVDGGVGTEDVAHCRGDIDGNAGPEDVAHCRGDIDGNAEAATSGSDVIVRRKTNEKSLSIAVVKKIPRVESISSCRNLSPFGLEIIDISRKHIRKNR
jgi:hypothetical protein